MEENKEKMTPVQLVLVICSGICLFAAILLWIFGLAGIVDAENAKIPQSIFWILIITAQLLIACANWKKQKVMSTVTIGLWSFFLGGFVFGLLSAIMK